MRRDLQKLLCEQERHGSSRSFKEVRRKKVFQDDDEVAGREGMKVRYVHGHGEIAKSFSENFNPLWGIIRKNVGRKWDDVFSELCEVFDMRNHVNAHILVHLWDFVERYTYVDDDGDIMVRSQYGGDESLARATCEYYVHPVNGLLLKNDYWKGYRNYYNGLRNQKVEQVNVIAVSGTIELRRRDEDSPWFVCNLVAVPAKIAVTKVDPPTSYRKTERTYTAWVYPYPIIDVWSQEDMSKKWNAKTYCVSYRSASKKDLKKYLPKTM